MVAPPLHSADRWARSTARSDLHVTWHTDDVVVVSLWRNGACIASAPLDLAGAASLASYLVDHLATIASRPSFFPAVTGPPPVRGRLRGLANTLVAAPRHAHAAEEPTERLRLVPPAE